MLTKLCLCVAFFLIAGALADSTNENVPHSISLLDGDKPHPKVAIIVPTVGPQPSSSTEKTTTTSTTTSTTTTEPTTTSTTTPKPTTTSTTPKPTTTSTTPKPTTTSTAKPTTPAPPTPTPHPDNKVGVWNVTELVDNKTVACIVASMNVNIVVPYIKADPKNNSIHTNASQEFIVPSTAKASGTCTNTTQTLKLSWTEGKVDLSLKFAFQKNNKSEFTLSTVNVSIPANKDLFPDIVDNATDFSLVSLNASAPIPLHQSYLCLQGVNFTLAGPAHNKNATPAELVLTHVQFQAFADATANKFDSAVDCAAVPYVTPDIVPIAVGCSLAALVAVVLVAYVIGRRRSAARGYLSM